MNRARRTLVGVALGALLALSNPGGAFADGETLPGDQTTTAGTSGSGFFALVDGNEPSSSTGGQVKPASNSAVSYSYLPYCERGEGITGDGFYGCGGQVTCEGDGLVYLQWATYPDGTSKIVDQVCIQPGEAGPPVVTPGAAYTAFQTIPLPASTLAVAPPGGRTLVNFETIFSTAAAPFDTTVTLLQQQVDFHITPSTYAWTYGDGTGDATDNPGIAFEAGRPMGDYLTHRYLRATLGGDQASPRVDTTWSATFRVAGGPWQQVPGTVTKQGEPVALEIMTATPQLVAAD